MNIRPATPADAAQVCAIYNHYIAHTCITFEEALVSEAEMRARIEALTAPSARQRHPWLVWTDGDQGELHGYAYASPWKTRTAYRHTAEVTIYLRDGSGGQGRGKALYTALLDALAHHGCHVALGCIAIPNDASVRLHEALGFEKVGHFTEVGHKFGRWLDVGYWQKRLLPHD